jgi:hypothetical protein
MEAKKYDLRNHTFALLDSPISLLRKIVQRRRGGVLGLKGLRTELAQRRMQTLAVVDHWDVFEDRLAGVV